MVLPGAISGYLGSAKVSSHDPTLVYYFFGLVTGDKSGSSLFFSEQASYARLGCPTGEFSPNFTNVNCQVGLKH
jgi:hypothetical protein